MRTPPEWAREIPEMYDAARRTMHDLGFPWTDPRTQVTYPPPPCACEWVTIHQITHIAIDEADPIAHTAIQLLGCARCRMVVAFPASNLDLVTPRARRVLHLELARAGWWLPWPDKWRDYREAQVRSALPNCTCRTPGCGHRASEHTGPGGGCVICGRACWS